MTFNISEHAHIVHTLKSTRQESYYAGYIMAWNHETLSGKWLKNYLDIFTKKVEIPKSFINIYGIKQYHLNLIRRMYFDSHDLGCDCITNLEYKRPYGNSAVMTDVFDAYNAIEKVIIYTDDSDDSDEYDWIKDNNSLLEDIHNDTMNFLDLMLKELDLNYDEWENIGEIWSPNWQPTQKALRKAKLERILE